MAPAYAAGIQRVGKADDAGGGVPVVGVRAETDAPARFQHSLDDCHVALRQHGQRRLPVIEGAVDRVVRDWYMSVVGIDLNARIGKQAFGGHAVLLIVIERGAAVVAARGYQRSALGIPPKELFREIARSRPAVAQIFQCLRDDRGSERSAGGPSALIAGEAQFRPMIDRPARSARQEYPEAVNIDPALDLLLGDQPLLDADTAQDWRDGGMIGG